MKLLKIGAALCAAVVMTGCATTSTLIEKRNLDTQTKMSETIFLDPVAQTKQTVYLQIRNTSDKPDFDIRGALSSSIAARGWRVVNDPDQANFMLQANILQVGMTDKTAAETAFRNGYGGVLGSAIAGAAISGATGGSGRNMAGAALVVGAADFVGGLLVKDVYFSAITDIQLSQRARPGQKVSVSGRQDLAQGTSGGEMQLYDETSDWKRYRTRVLSSANKANLDWVEAQPALVAGLSQVIGGLF